MSGLAFARRRKDRSSSVCKNPLAPRLLVDCIQARANRQYPGAQKRVSTLRSMRRPSTHLMASRFLRRTSKTHGTPPRAVVMNLHGYAGIVPVFRLLLLTEVGEATEQAGPPLGATLRAGLPGVSSHMISCPTAVLVPTIPSRPTLFRTGEPLRLHGHGGHLLLCGGETLQRCFT